MNRSGGVERYIATAKLGSSVIDFMRAGQGAHFLESGFFRPVFLNPKQADAYRTHQYKREVRFQYFAGKITIHHFSFGGSFGLERQGGIHVTITDNDPPFLKTRADQCFDMVQSIFVEKFDLGLARQPSFDSGLT